MSKEPIEFLKHISDECAYLLSLNKDLSKTINQQIIYKRKSHIYQYFT